MRGTIGTNHNLILSLHHFEGKNEGNHWRWSQRMNFVLIPKQLYECNRSG